MGPRYSGVLVAACLPVVGWRFLVHGQDVGGFFRFLEE